MADWNVSAAACLGVRPRSRAENRAPGTGAEVRVFAPVLTDHDWLANDGDIVV
jgi:hypothetical protein